MKRHFLIFFILLQNIFIASAQIYVSPTGDDNNPGTFDLPFRSLTKAVSVSGPDTLIYMRGGVYNDSTTHILDKAGLPDHYIKVWAYQDEIPILDFSNQPVSTSSRGIRITGDYWYLKGLVIRNAKDNGIHIQSFYNIVENCILYNNNDTGIQISNGGSYNLILDCDSYMNNDPLTNGENADGFAAKLGIGPGNVFRGCRAWNNSDDGFDMYEAADTVLVDNCWAFRNGYNIWGFPNFAGDGNGFKLGGNYFADPHKIIRCLAFDNPAKGFDQNNNTAGITAYNNTAWGNGSKNYSFPTQPTTGIHILKNNISFDGQISIASNSTEEANSWQGFTVTSADFKSLDSTLAIMPRDSEGHLPNVDLLRLAAGSSLIDAGVYVGLPFNDAAPDLGAFETEGIQNSVNEEYALDKFQLNQNYPNPFNPSTTFDYSISSSGIVKLFIYDVLGNMVDEPLNQYQTAGSHKIIWVAQNSKTNSLPSGIYFARLQWEGRKKTIKLILMK
jgi:Pel9A-like, right handed beta helix region/Secretion system C-terminal sorting domain